MTEKPKKNIFFEPTLDKIKNDSLPNHYRVAWTEESLYFEQKTKKQVITPFSNDHVGTSFSDKKSKYLLVFLATFFLIIISRIIFLQIINGNKYFSFAERNRQRIIPIPAERGLVYDRNNIQLTKNIPSFSLAIIPQDLPRDKNAKEKIIEKLTTIINKNQEDIRKILEEYGSYSYESIVIQDNIDYDTALTILIASSDLPGIQIQRGSKRLYLNDIINQDSFTSSTPSSLSHIIGYIGKLNKNELDELYSHGYLPSDNIGKMGIEKTYESFLRGTYGKKRIEVNAYGKEQAVLAEESPKPGFHTKLAIDAKMQNALEEIMKKQLSAIKRQRASGIVLNPKNGEILALVSLPSYDNNDFSGGIDFATYKKYTEDINKPLFNRAISGTYPSGSTIKPGMSMAALQEKIITANTSFLSTGGLLVGNWFFPDWAAGGHGVTNVRKAIAWSINTFFYYIGGGYNDFVGLGIERIEKYFKLFGLGSKTGLDLPGEQAGFIPNKAWKEETKGERWYIGDTYNLSIGQGDLLVTPLQIANLTAFVANGGTLYKPQIVKSVVDPITKEEQKIEPEIIWDNVIDKNNVEIVKMGMKDCVTYGSCHRLSYLPFSSAGKTGTAQWSSNKENHAWFTSFAPFENPEIVVTILIEEGGEGGIVSSPIAYEFYKWWWNYKNSL